MVPKMSPGCVITIDMKPLFISHIRQFISMPKYLFLEYRQTKLLKAKVCYASQIASHILCHIFHVSCMCQSYGKILVQMYFGHYHGNSLILFILMVWGTLKDQLLLLC